MKRYALRIAALLFAVALLPTTFHPAAAQEPISQEERDRIESVVRDYLLQNPEIILEAIQILEERERTAQQQHRQQAIASLVPTLTASPLTPVIGAQDGDVTLIEFFDYQCGYCKRFFPGLEEVMAQDDGLRVILVEFPILGPASLVASRAALAARNQGLYVEFHTALMQSEGRLTEEVIFHIADTVGLDEDRLRADMDDPAIMDYLSLTREIASSLEITGTPSMVIGDQFIGGYIPTEDLQTVIEAQRADG